jgi:transposase
LPNRLFPHKERTVKKFIGIDLHKKTIVICVVNKDRQVLESRRFYCAESERIREWFAGQGEFEVVVEATAAYEWFVQLVEPHGERVVLAHPGKLRVIAESTRKSDKLDARTLAEFLALDMIPAAYRPTPRQREHRRLVRHRHFLRGRITSVKNRIRNLLADYNADRPDLFTREGLEHMQELALLSADRFVLESMLKELSLYYEQINAVEKQCRQFAKRASPAEAAARKLLATIPGVGPITIEVFLSEIADVSRFGSQKKVTAYAGLAPGQRISDGKRRELAISHRGSGMLRWVLNQASWQLVQRSPRWRRIFEAIGRRRGKKKAITAISRRLLCVMTSIVNSGRPYQEAA